MMINKKTLFVSLILIAIIAAIIFAFLLPFYNRIKAASQELLIIEKELATMTEKQKELYLWQKEAPLIEDDISRIRELFVDSEMPIDFLRFLEETAGSCGLPIRISLLRSEEEKFLNLMITVNGSYPNSLRFLEKLENAPYLIYIEKADIFRPDKDKFNPKIPPGEVEFSLSIKTYVAVSDSPKNEVRD